MITGTIDTSGFDLVIPKLVDATGLPMKTVTLAESKSVLQTCMDRTKLAAKKVLRDRMARKFNQYAAGDIGANARGQEPRISIAPKAQHNWWVDRNAQGGRTFYIMNGNRRWSDERWAAYQAEEADRRADLKLAIAEALARRGLPKQSWYMLAEIIDIRLKAPEEVINAKVRGVRRLDLVSAVVSDVRNAFVIEFTNSSRISYHKGGARILSTALQGRVKYFRRNLQKGVFESLEKVHRAYPNLVQINSNNS